MKFKSLLLTLLLFLGAGAAFFIILMLVNSLVRPDMSAQVPVYSPDEIQAVEKSRAVGIDPDNPTVLYRKVDYRERKKGAWYPKGEAPILAELVKEGKLPPLVERIGEEPAVVEGVEGIGKYGGTWIRMANGESDVGSIWNRLSYPTLFRWSPQGYPVVPHLAKGLQASADNREFIVTLRKGIRWSDGHPFTADDIMYWWIHEANDSLLHSHEANIMKYHGEYGRIEKLDDFRVKFSFKEPYGLFPVALGTFWCSFIVSTPAHYLWPYHPTLGDQALIEKIMKARNLNSKLAVYRNIKQWSNPEHPRFWPWVYRTYKANPPYDFVRNPYFPMVDTKGNQLPYLDRLLIEVRSPDMLSIAASNGGISMQSRHIRYNDYTNLMQNRAGKGYQIYHWYPADRSNYALFPNLNRKVDPRDPTTFHRHALLNQKAFRQALSLAINRRDIIDAEYNGEGEPAQIAPGPASYFYEPTLYKSFTEYDTTRANQLLDSLGLTQRDYEGYRTFTDGTRMVFYINYTSYTGPGPAQFIVEDWARVGVRAVHRERSRPLFTTERDALTMDFVVWGSNGEYFPILEPYNFVPTSYDANYAIGFGRWYRRGGLFGNPEADIPGAIEPPLDHPLRRAMEIYQEMAVHSQREKQREIFSQILRIAADNVWSINITTPPPALVVVKNGFRNVPQEAVSSWIYQTPGNTGMETYFFDDPYDSPGAVQQIKKAILEVTPMPDSPTQAARTEKGGGAGKVLGYLVAVLVTLGVAAICIKQPYIARRLVIMVPTLLIISTISFTIIQLPPGDFLTTQILALRETGDTADLQAIEDLRQTFYLDDPIIVRYLRWMGFYWFKSFDEKDRGLLQGNLGRSMESSKTVNEVVGDRILLTILISLGTILFTWITAIPIGIYSAVRQYSVGDYILTFLGFIGMCVPAFLLALLLMAWGGVSGLFSSQYGAQPEWDWPKVVDLLKHIWIPVVVLGVGGTAGMIRVMRGNLLDELKKPYVITALAKGVPPLKLLFKYPVRLALNPFVSGIGGLFPQLVSGGAIVAMVLSLPTVGPLMLNALLSEDMYLAGSMLMILSLLSIIGTLVSDLLLLWLDPRIRFKSGTR